MTARTATFAPHIAAPLARGNGAPYQPLVVVLAPLCVGILLDRWLVWPAWLWWSLAAASWSAWWAMWRSGRSAVGGVALSLACVGTAAAWHHLRWANFDAHDLGFFAAEEPAPACVEVVALQTPRRIPAPEFDPLQSFASGDRSRLRVAVVSVRDGAEWRAATGGGALIVEGHLLGVHTGDTLRVFADISTPGPPRNPGEFDLADYSRGERRLTLLRAGYPDGVTRLAEGSAFSPRRLWGELRGRGDEYLWRVMNRPRAGLAAALLLGSREQLDHEETLNFVVTGMIHILAISGFNVAILAGGLIWALRWGLLARRPALWCVAALIVIYTLVTDAEPPIVRAAAAVCVYCVAQANQRRSWPFNSLAASAIVVLALNPTDLFRSGAQLSFLAAGVLAWWSGRRSEAGDQDPLERLVAESRPWPIQALRRVAGSVGQALLVGFWIWLLALPLVMGSFHLVSPVALVMTTLLVIPVAIAMFSGLALLLMGWWLPGAAFVCGSLCDGALWTIERSLANVAAAPGSHFWVAGPETWWIVGLYAAVGLALIAPTWTPPRRWRWALAAGWIAIGFAASLGKSWGREGRLDCTFLAVGHGCATVLEMPNGRTLMYDVGQLGSPWSAARTTTEYLWSRGITRLDGVILSHADVDHYNGLPELLRRMSVDVVYVSPVMFETPSAALDRLAEAIRDAGCEVRTLAAGDTLRVDAACRLEVLHPPPRGILGSDNANSLLLNVEFAGRRILLTGDLESPGIDDVLAERPLDCDVLLAPHHGSTRSNPPGMAQWSTPEWVVVSGGHEAGQAAVEAAYRAAGGEVLRTAHDGAVRVTISAEDFAVQAWRRGAASWAMRPAGAIGGGPTGDDDDPTASAAPSDSADGGR